MVKASRKKGKEFQGKNKTEERQMALEGTKISDLFYVLPLYSCFGGLDPHGTILPSSG